MRYAIHDGPGIRTTVFFKGCPLRCKWCHNPESLSREIEMMLREDRCLRCGRCAEVCPHGAVSAHDGQYITSREVCARCGTCLDVCYAEARVLIGRQMTVEEVLREIERDVPFFEESGGGVTFSGGEPLLQHEFLAALLKGCRDRRISTAVDTTGYAAKETVREIAALTDLFLYDLKTMDDTVHRAYTGVSNVLILSNLQEVSVMKKEIIIRVPLIPGVNDSLENIRATGRFVASLGSAREISLLPFHLTGIDKYARIGRDYTMPHVDPMSQEKIEHIAAELRTFGVPVSTGGAHHD